MEGKDDPYGEAFGEDLVSTLSSLVERHEGCKSLEMRLLKGLLAILRMKVHLRWILLYQLVMGMETTNAEVASTRYAVQ